MRPHKICNVEAWDHASKPHLLPSLPPCSSYVLLVAGQDQWGNVNSTIQVLPFTTPDVTPPLFLGEQLAGGRNRGEVEKGVWQKRFGGGHCARNPS